MESRVLFQRSRSFWQSSFPIADDQGPHLLATGSLLAPKGHSQALATWTPLTDDHSMVICSKEEKHKNLSLYGSFLGGFLCSLSRTHIWNGQDPPRQFPFRLENQLILSSLKENKICLLVVLCSLARRVTIHPPHNHFHTEKRFYKEWTPGAGLVRVS